MKPIVVAAGDRFGRLEIVSEMAKVSGRRVFECRCDCGGVTTLSLDRLRTGNTKSCGCLRNELSGDRGRAFLRKHGEAVAMTPEYVAWSSMLRRVRPTSPKAKHYHARGITVCARWVASYEDFLADVGRRPAPGFSIDRINNDGNYEPGNVRWADAATQNRNRRRPTRSAA